MNTVNPGESSSLRPFAGHRPQLGERCYVDPRALVIGQAVLGDDVSIWPMTVLRGDVCRITIGARSNIQDGSILHVNAPQPDHPQGMPLVVGSDVTVGHGVILHACTVGDRCLVGMGSTVLDLAVLEDEVMLAAGSLVTPGKVLTGGYLWGGRPARQMRALKPQEIAFLRHSAAHYAELKDQYLAQRKANP